MENDATEAAELAKRLRRLASELESGYLKDYVLDILAAAQRIELPELQQKAHK
jgi:hypothetical protein